jgi:DNA-binding LacI/PurR family transcriptional regulator
MPVTIKDIAKKAGVSHATVSRALNNHPAIPEKTAAVIRNLALEMGYLPSAVARGLKTNRSHVLGVIVSRIDNPYFGEIVQGIEDTLQNTGYSIFIASSHLDYVHEKTIIQAFGEHRVDGVIVGSVSFNRDHTELLRQYGIPIVVINNQSPSDYRFSIAHDDVFGSKQIMRHLIELGHHRIAYLGNINALRINQDRIRGYEEELEKAGISPDEEIILDLQGGEMENGMEGMTELLGRKNRPTAVFCFNDLIAIGALTTLQKCRIKVPDEISIAGFDNIPYSAFTYPSLTTFDQPKRLIGAEAARMLLALITDPDLNNDKQKTISKMIRGELLIRESTAICPERRPA